MAAVVIRDTVLQGAHHRPTQIRADLWMVWDDATERDQLIALLQGKTYPPTRTGSA
jgi:hypothetical protein